LTAFAQGEQAQHDYLVAVSARAAESMRVGVRMILDAIEQSFNRTAFVPGDGQNRISRAYGAGVLHIAGQHASNVGAVETTEITLATGVTTPFKQYNRVTAMLWNVNIDGDPMMLADRSFEPKDCTPEQLVEASVLLRAHDDTGAHIFENARAWIANRPMPPEYAEARRGYNESVHISQVTHGMLMASMDPGLNPAIQTYEHLAAVSPGLAVQVADVERPLREIDFSLLIPSWAKSAAEA
jgi:hypothetical protein